MSIERDCSGAGIFLTLRGIEGGELGGVRGSDEVKVEVEYDFLIGEGVWMLSKLVVVVVDEPDDTEKKEDEEVDEFDDDLVEVHAKEMFEALDVGRANIWFSGSRRGVLGRVAMGEEGSDCVSSGRMWVGVSSIK
jgi:hypothetical protein